MRGNWDESEPVALAPESSSTQHHLGSGVVGFPQQHQQQQQQQPSLLPPSSPDKPSLDGSSIESAIKQQQQQEAAAYPLTTPAWANLVVKNEPHDEAHDEAHDEKNNDDSGISPGHYTSDTASPHSDRSSSMMVGVNGLSPNSASSASPEPRLPIMHHHEANLHHHDMTYDYSHRHHHMHHSGSAGIPSPEDMSRDASMSPPAHQDSNDSNNNDEPSGGPSEGGVEQPIVNSQGKVKTFRCKQCPYVAVTKRDFWAHTASHIKPEKLLTCPKCPFVTEYKHHLEYHLRNHFGSKPYKCEKCSYSCVNKSMLNSHLKSHSNVYQFRCADCSYATKYCHSLKLHLRKYQHKPAMVLNADGTPNPLPIIDVYGTRRGPKAKPKKDSHPAPPPLPIEQLTQQQQQHSSAPSSPSMPTTPPLQVPATLTPQFQFNAMNGLPAFGGFNGAAALPAAAMPFLAGFPYNQIFGGFPMGNPFTALATANNLAQAASGDEQQQQPANYAQQAMMAGGGIMSTKRESSPIGYEHSSPSPVHDEPQQHPHAPVDLTEMNKSAAPLDLSKPETPKQLPRVPGSTNRRKGRAVKLDRRLMQENDSDEEMPQQQDNAVATPTTTPPVKQPVETEVYMQLKHLRTDMQHMYRYICRLEENLCTRQ